MKWHVRYKQPSEDTGIYIYNRSVVQLQLIIQEPEAFVGAAAKEKGI